MNELDWTGERLVTSVTGFHGTIEHLHRYALAVELAKNKRVLDIACGEGYGSNLLSKVADSVYGVDISDEAVTHASQKYKANNLQFYTGSTSNIPLPDSSVDLVVSFETIEHHDEHERMMEEIKRVLSPGGILMISSPEKSVYKTRDPGNEFHIKELTIEEFKGILNSFFRYVDIYDQRFVVGSIINKSDSSGSFAFYDGDYTSITNKLSHDEFYNLVFFNVAVVSDDPVANMLPIASVFNGLDVLKSEFMRRDIENKKQLDNLNKQITELKKSYSFKVGNILLSPLSFVKSKLK